MTLDNFLKFLKVSSAICQQVKENFQDTKMFFVTKHISSEISSIIYMTVLIYNK